MASSDHQIPFHDKRAIDLWFAVMKWFKPDMVDYLGDVSDQVCFAKFSEGKTDEFLNQMAKNKPEDLFPYVQEQERPVAEFYEQTRKMLPRAQLFSALGNHDVRVFEYIDKKLPSIKDQVTANALWRLDDLGYDYIYYGDLPKLRFGNVYGHHGISAKTGSGLSVKSDMENLDISLIRGHSHRCAAVYKTYELTNRTLVGYEIGHMSDLKSTGMSYTNIRDWQQAFMIGHIIDNVPHLQIISIIEDEHGKSCVVDGKYFSA